MTAESVRVCYPNVSVQACVHKNTDRKYEQNERKKNGLRLLYLVAE